MGSLRCTLCCGETFDTITELSAHLKKILDDIFCSRCRLKFCSLKKLLDHYVSEECGAIDSFLKNNESSQLKKLDLERESMNDSIDSVGEVVEGELPEQTILHRAFCRDRSAFENAVTDQKCSTAFENVISLQPFEIISDDDNQNTSKENVSSSSKPDEKNGHEKPTEEEGNMFYCSCGMKFVSIFDHLMTHHFGEEVFINESPVQLETLLNTSFPKSNLTVIEVPKSTVGLESVHQVIEADGQLQNLELEETEVIVYNKDILNDENEISRAVSTPITAFQMKMEGKVVECVDKNDRLCLRKFDRRKNYWSEKDDIMAAHMLSQENNFRSTRNLEPGNIFIKSKDEAEPKKHPGYPNKVYQCITCNKTFQTLIHFCSHVCLLKTSLSTCSFCGPKSDSSKQATAHLLQHQRQKRLAATTVGEMQAGQGILMEVSALDEDLVDLQFEHCGEMYNKQNELVYAAMNSEELPFTCNKCSESFDLKRKLTCHMWSHQEQKMNVDLCCKNPFAGLNALKLHYPSRKRDNPFKCAYCGKMFSSPNQRMRHERIHTGERPCMCEICGKTFRVSYCLTVHRRTHTDERPYCCDICGKRFKTNSSFRHHLKVHSDEKNKKCPYCPKAFKTSVQLSGHKKTHTKPFWCTECNRRFSSLYAAKSHRELHKIGENWFPFRCFVCGASYARLHFLQVHMKTHRAGNVPEDIECVLEI